MHFTDFDIDAFLRDHWQKKPVVIRNPWHAWRNPVEPDELAGLSCDDDIESRLIVQNGASWTVEHGPFAAARFRKLGKVPWTLLVQAVDQSVPDVAALIEPFRFIPNWRIDDVMVSYASDGGGAGPHFDQYDVFLIQGLGKRRWQVGPLCDAATALMPHDDLRLLADFEAADEWVLDAGDVLYVPPGFAHNGVAVGDNCMTYSVGFRAPSRSELMAHWCDHLLSEMDDDDRYVDPGLRRQDNPGEITPAALIDLRRMIADAFLDGAGFARWFGIYSSTPKYPDRDWRPDESVTLREIRAHVASGVVVERNAASRFAYIRNDGDSVALFVDGEHFDLCGDEASLAVAICGASRLVIDPMLKADALIKRLIDQGSLCFDQDN